MTDERRKEIEKDCEYSPSRFGNSGYLWGRRVAAHCRELLAEVDRLREAIRQHRDERGDDRCHADDGRLYAVLPEGDTRPERETAVTLENCAKYIECRQAGREYVSPQRRIEELEAEIRQSSAALADSHNQLHTMHAANAELRRVASALAEALAKIERWHGEFPATGRTWADGSEMSYGAAYGSNGERDYMRQVARDALAAFAALGEAK